MRSGASTCTGELRNKIGKDNPVNGFLIPNGVLDFAVDTHGVIHAANPGKHRVERYAPDGELLGHIGRFDGNDPAGFTGCCNPTNVAVGDCIYVTEKAVPRAKAYDFDGSLLAVIASDVFDPNVKNMSIAAGPHGRVYVVDTVKLAILAFEAASMSDLTRRDLLGTAVRGTVLAAMGGGVLFLVRKASGQVVWQVDASRCINSRLGEAGVEACNLCTTECVVALSAVRAVNEYARCGRCNICPAYFNITSAVERTGTAEREALPARCHRAQAHRQSRSRRPRQQFLRIRHR